MLKEYLSNIANAFRSALDTTDEINAQDFANKVGEVSEKSHNDGYLYGVEQGIQDGREAEYNAFWDTFQNNGNRTTYSYAFYGSAVGWNDTTFNPKYPITIIYGEAIFQNSPITRIPVDIIITESASISTNARCFSGCTRLKTIKKIVMAEHITATSWFANCTSLENITFEGVIGRNIDFSYSPLTSQSMLSVIEHLKDYSNDGGTFTVTFKADRETMLTDEQKAVATNKGWSLVWS